MAVTPAADGRDDDGGRHVVRRVVVLLVALVGTVVAALVATASTPAPTLTGVVPSAGYTTLTVSLSHELRAASDTTKPLGLTAFVLRVGTTDTAVKAVSKTDATTYVLTANAAVAAGTTSVVVPAGQAKEVDGTAVPELVRVVPLTGGDAARAAAGLSAVQVDGKPFGPVPFVGSWFSSLQPKTTAAATAGVTTMTTAVGVTAATGDAEAQELVSRPRPLTDLVTGLAPVLVQTASMTSQSAVESALEGVPGIGQATFTSTGLTVTLDPAEVAGRHASDQRTAVAALPYVVDGRTSFDLHLEGSVELALGTTGPATLRAVDLELRPRALDLPATATVGMVTVTPTDTVGTGDLALGVVCSGGCSATPTVTAAGTVDLDLDAVAYRDAGGSTSVDVSSSTGALRVRWSPATWDLAGLSLLKSETAPGAEAKISALTPTVTNRSTWDAAELAQFDQLDSHAVTLALEWIGNWVRTTDAIDALGTQLPVVGLTVGDVLELSDQVGGKVTGLVEALEPTPGAAKPTAQELVAVLCAEGILDCAAGAAALPGLDITTDGITYDVQFDVCAVLFGAESGTCAEPGTVDVAQTGPSLDLAAAGGTDLADELGPLGGIKASLRTGTWKGSAAATLAFELRLDLRPDAEVQDALGITPADYPGPGFPATDRVTAGDLCRGLALALGTTETRFAGANGVLVEGTPSDACGSLAWVTGSDALATVSVPGTGDAAATSRLVTATDVCTAVALKNGLQLDTLLALNSQLGTGSAQLTACAALAKRQLTDATAPAFTFYRAPAGDPLPVPYRLSIAPLGTEPLVAASVDVSGDDLEGDVLLGVLDLGLTGTISATPEVTVDLAGPERLTLVDLAEAADDATPDVAVGALLDMTLGGDLEVDLSLANDLAFPDDPARFRLQGGLAELAGTAPVTVETDCDALEAGDTGLCVELGPWTDAREMTPAQVLRMLTGLLDRVAGLAGSGDAGFELPLVGVSVQDLVGWNGKLRAFADTVTARDPQTLTQLQEAVDAALAGAGLPSGSIEVGVDEGVFTLSLPLGISETAEYPFGFDVGLGEDLPVRISPADGGAKVTALGEASFRPTLGLDLDSPLDTDLDDRVFLVVDEESDPVLSGSLVAEVAGDVVLGPLATDFRGEVGGDPSVTLRLSSLGEDGRLTLGMLAALMDPAEGSEDAPALPDDLLAWGGELSLEAAVTGPTGNEIELGWSADLERLITEDGYTGEFGDMPTLEDLVGLRLDLATLVQGTSQTTRFLGRALAESDALSTELPLVGDELAALSDVGEDLQGFADTVDDLYEQVKEEDGAFVAGINESLATEVCGPLEVLGDCRAELLLYEDVDSEEPMEDPDVTRATRVELQLQIEKEEQRTLSTSKLLDVPGFEVDTAADLSVTAGYRLGLTLALDVENGFSVKGFEVGDGVTRLIELYGSAGITNGGGGGDVKIGGVTAFTLDDLDMSLGGSLGPEDESAGFALDMPEPLTLMDVMTGRRSIDEIFEPRISVAVDARITIGTSDAGGSIPKLAFPVFFGWEVDGVIGGGLELESPSLSIGKDAVAPEESEYVTIDVTSLVNDVVKPALVELNQYNPVAQAEPIKDALNSEIPVLDQDVRGLLDGALGSDPRWQLFSFLLDLDEVATSLEGAEPDASPVRIPLGGYTVLPREDAGYFAPGTDSAAYSVWDREELRIIRDLVQNLSAAAGGAKTFAKPVPKKPAAPGTWDGDLRGTSTTSFSGTVPKKPVLKQVVRMPILDDPLTAATLLFGGEVEPVSFIEIAPPAIDFGMSVKFERTLFDLNVGFLEAKLAVALEGAVGVTLRVGLGYSSHGLTSGDPVNGLYLVDAYDGNRPLPMISLGGRVSARVDGRFAVLGVAEASFSGAGYVRLEGGLDLFDESLVVPEAGRGDGKFHVDEMLRVVAGHRIDGPAASAADAFCIFRPMVQLQAGLAFGGSARVLGVEVWSGSYAEDWNLVDEEYSCPYAARPAQLQERRVVLAAGPDAALRLGDDAVTAEEFRIDQLVVDGVPSVRVRGAGAFAGYTAMTFPLEAVDEVFADLGDGDDVVTVDPSVTVPVQLFGGAGNDALQGGAGDDLLDGGDGVDLLEPRGGDDEVVVGADGVGSDTDLTAGYGLGACATGCNVVVLGGGDDVVTGGPAPVVYRSGAGDFGAARIDHTGPTMVLDLAASTEGVDGVVDGLGLHVTSPQGSVDTSDPSTLARLLGSSGGDTLRVVDGPQGMHVDGGQGADLVTVDTNGDDRTARVHDSGSAIACPGTESCGDRLVVRGTAGDDRFLLRAHVTTEPANGPDRSSAAATPADEGVVAVLSPESGTDTATAVLAPTPVDPATPTAGLRLTGRAQATQLVFYDPTLETLHVEGVGGQDEFALDDVATTTTVEGGRGAGPGSPGSRFQVGQVFGWETDAVTAATATTAAFRVPLTPEHPVTPWETDQFRYRETIRGWVSYGISHPTTVRGGLSDDRYTVYSNRAELELEGVGGDDTFTLRSFIANGSITAAGGDGDDTFNYDFEYVANNEVDIEGGSGFNTFVAIGTELQDGFTVTSDGVSVCLPRASAPGVAQLDGRVSRTPGIRALPLQPDPNAPVGATGTCAISTSARSVQRYVLDGLQGNNVFWVRGTPAGSETFLLGGDDASTYLVGDAGDLSDVQGTVEVVADEENLSPAAEAALRAVDLDFPLPVLLDGDVTYAPVGAVLPADASDPAAESTLVVDGSATTSALAGSLVPDGTEPGSGFRLSGLGLAEASDDWETGDGRTYSVAGGIAARGLDTVRVVLGSGADDLVLRGTHAPYGGTPTAPLRDGRTEVYAGPGADRLQLDAVSGPTWVALEDGADALRAGTGTAVGIRAPLEVYGGAGLDDVEVDAGMRGDGLRADLDRVLAVPATWSGRTTPVDMAVLSQLEMTGVVRHDSDVEVLRVKTGSAADDVNLRGSTAGRTELRTAGADDRVYVSGAARQALGAPVPGLLGGSLADVRDVDLDAGSGDNLLMLSDRDSATARTVTMTAEVPAGADTATVGMKRASIAVAGLATVTFDATGGTFTRGVTTWLGAKSDTVGITGVRRDGTDLALLAWEGRPLTNGVRTLTTLNAGAGDDVVTAALPVTSGLLVANLEEGDDTLLGEASARGFAAFGGDGADRMESGSGDDLLLGDWGRVEHRSSTGALVGVLGVPDRMDLVSGLAQAPSLVASCTSQPRVSAAGVLDCAAVTPVTGQKSHPGLPVRVRNWLSVGAGDDVALGGGGSDRLDATDGRNALVADHGSVLRVLPSALGGTRRITTNDGFLDLPVLEEPFAYDVVVRDDLGGAPDLVRGGLARDWVLTGLGDDLVNADRGSDLVFGGDGSDVLWGGLGDDRVYAGAGDDQVDLKLMAPGTGLKSGTTSGWPVGTWWKGTPLMGPALWKDVAPGEDVDLSAASTNGSDLVFGGDGPDAMQADVGGAGRVPGDRLVDWYGAYNVFYVCQGAYGAGYVLRVPSPSTVSALEQLARADGAAGPTGARQLAIPVSGNRSPTHPAHPGNNHGC